MIYKIHADLLNYLIFYISDKEARNKLGSDTMFNFEHRPVSYITQWQPLEIEFCKASTGKNEKTPDIMTRRGRLFLNQKAYDAIGQILAPHGEFLPITHQGSKGYLFNILAVAESVDGVDKELSTLNEYNELQSLAFHDRRVEELSIFRTEFDNFMGIYCQESLKTVIDKLELSGVMFSPDLGNVIPPDPAAVSETVN